jgi:hypothetical protein
MPFTFPPFLFLVRNAGLSVIVRTYLPKVSLKKNFPAQTGLTGISGKTSPGHLILTVLVPKLAGMLLTKNNGIHFDNRHAVTCRSWEVNGKIIAPKTAAAGPDQNGWES